MNFWLITVGEPLPQLSGNSRLWRTGMLAQELIARGHTVTWWTSRVDHFTKRFFACDGDVFQAEPALTVRLLSGRLYQRNISIARLINHWQIARHFRRQARAVPAPDVILCSFPTIELSLEAVRFGKPRKIPVVLDVRDLWPDIFLQSAPGALRGAVRLALHSYFVATQRALAGADALIAVSARYLEWGLKRAARVGGLFDRVFPLAYSLPGRTDAARSAGIELLHERGIERGSIVCLFAGSLGQTYDLAPVLGAAARFAAEPHSRFRFVICGDGERAEEWRLRAAGLPNVTFTGWLDQDAMRAMLMGADIGLAAYARDAPQGIPNKVIEYLAAGLPILSSLTGETQQMLEQQDCGRSYLAGDATSLYDALEELQVPELREQLAQNARRKFEADFRADTVYGQLASLLEQVASRRA